ncbi:MAG: sigma-70 family RNA polymerase sigma factor [Pseudolysinimonas sp.]
MTKSDRYSGRIMTALSSAVPRLASRAETRRAPAASNYRDFDVAEFVRTEYPRVVSAVRMIAGDRDSAVDAVQEALVQLLTDRDRAWPRNVAAWVTVVASNRARDVHRRNAVARRVTDRLRPSLSEDPAERAGRDLDVLAALETLPRRMRQVCVLHYLQDQTVREIALTLGIGTGTVKTQLHRGRIALAHQLGR